MCKIHQANFALSDAFNVDYQIFQTEKRIQNFSRRNAQNKSLQPNDRLTPALSCQSKLFSKSAADKAGRRPFA